MKGYEKSSLKVYIFCTETVKICAAASEYISLCWRLCDCFWKHFNVRLVLLAHTNPAHCTGLVGIQILFVFRYPQVQGRWIFKPSIKNVFIIIERLWKIFNTKCVYFVQEPWKKLCSGFWIYFFMLRIVSLLLKTFQCFLKNVRLLLKRYQCATASEIY